MYQSYTLHSLNNIYQFFYDLRQTYFLLSFFKFFFDLLLSFFYATLSLRFVISGTNVSITVFSSYQCHLLCFSLAPNTLNLKHKTDYRIVIRFKCK